MLKDLLITKYLLLILATFFWTNSRAIAVNNDQLIATYFSEQSSKEEKVHILKSLDWSKAQLSLDSFKLITNSGISLAKSQGEKRLVAKLELLVVKFSQATPAEKREKLEELIKKSSINNWDSVFLSASYFKARSYSDENNFAQANDLLDELLIVGEGALKRYPTIKASIYEELGIIAQFIGDSDRELAMFMASLEVHQALNDSSGLSSNYSNIGGSYFSRRQFWKALEYHFKALEIAEAIGFKGTQTASYVNIASVYGARSMFDSCLIYALQAEKLASEYAITKDIIISNDIIAACYINLDQADRAIKYQLKAFELETNSYYKNLLALNVGLNYIELKRFEEAKKYYLIALNLAEELKIPYVTVNTTSHLGHLSLDLEEFDLAQEYFNSALVFNKELGDPYLNGELYRGYAKLQHELGQFESSNAHIDSALLTVHEFAKRASLFLIQAENYSALHRHKEAGVAYENYVLYNDSAIQLSNRELEQSILARFSVEQAENQAKLALQQKEIADLNALEQRRLKVFGFVLFGLSLLSIVLILGRHRRYKIEKERNTKLRMEASQALIDHSREILENQSNLIIDKNRIIAELKNNLSLFFSDKEGAGEGAQNFLDTRILTNEDWDKFKVSFDVVYPGYMEACKNKFEGITTNELRLLCLYKLGMTKEEIADMLAVLPSSVKRSVNRFYQKAPIRP